MATNAPGRREVRKIRVVCKEKSHVKRPAFIDTFEFHRRSPVHDDDCTGRAAASYGLGEWDSGACAPCVGTDWRLTGGGFASQRLDQDNPISNDELYGGINRPPNHELLETARERWSLECPLCGLRADVRRERAERILGAKASNGVSRLRLSDVVAMLS